MYLFALRDYFVKFFPGPQSRKERESEQMERCTEEEEGRGASAH